MRGVRTLHSTVRIPAPARIASNACGKPRQARWSSPMDSAAALRSTNSTAAAVRPCTSPSRLPRRAASATTIPDEPPPAHPGRRAAALAGTAAALAGAAAIAGGVAAEARWALIRAGAAGGSSAGSSGKRCLLCWWGTGVAVILI
jgi:hypothetical protein